MGRRNLAPEDIVRYEEDGPKVVLLDQRRLPDEEVELECHSAAEVATAIREMAIRGAPAIGIAAAYGLALAAERGEDLEEAAATLAASRPTAVNLVWALEQLRDDRVPHGRAPCTRKRSGAATPWPRTPQSCSESARAR